MTRPETLQINAWTGDEGADGPPGNGWDQWGRKNRFTGSDTPLAHKEADPRDFMNPEVGWGLVLPESSGTPAQKATPYDTPEPIQQLHEYRGNGPVFRYSKERHGGVGFLRRYFPDRQHEDITIVGGVQSGTEAGTIPLYLCIVGDPEEIPWSLEYQLNGLFYVGRIDLEGPALKNYVSAVCTDWADSEVDRWGTVAWAVDLGESDITHLMQSAVTDVVVDELRKDPDTADTTHYVNGADATDKSLIEALGEVAPSFVVSTSHGETRINSSATLGVPVDIRGKTLDPNAIGSDWHPDGAVWFAHACCSAGTDAALGDRYLSLLDPDSSAARVIDSLQAIPSQTAPLAKAALGAERPARAFIGQVEPTFDYTMWEYQTQQFVTEAFCRGLVKGLFGEKPQPVGMAIRRWFLHNLDKSWLEAYGKNVDPNYQVWCQLSILDRQSQVLLGDPAVGFAERAAGS